MELVLQILMLFVALGCTLKLSFWKGWQAALFGVVCGAFVMAVYPLAAMQSKTQLADFLANPSAMQDMAVVVTLEVSVCFAYCFLASKKIYGGTMPRWGRVLQWYGSLLIFPVLFFALTESIYAFPGTDFATIAWILAGCAAVGLPLLRWGVKHLFPQSDYRLEVYFLVSLFLAILGLVSTVNGNVTYAAPEGPSGRGILVPALILFTVVFLAGFAWNRIKWIIKQNRKNRSETWK